jgi:phosphatidylserine decarboxylase
MTPYDQPERPSLTAFPMAKAGLPFIYASAFTSAIFALLGMKIPAILMLGATFCICFFFRDPDRVVPTLPGAVVSPADGRIIIAKKIDSTPFFNGPCFKISIFMTVFNVHVNRIIYDGNVENIVYRPGKFYSADKDLAGLENEHNAVFIKTLPGRELCIVQVAGLIARRIICTVQKGEPVKKGQKFGLICFGSRLDVYLPEDFKVRVILGNKVKAGETILGEII